MPRLAPRVPERASSAGWDARWPRPNVEPLTVQRHLPPAIRATVSGCTLSDLRAAHLLSSRGPDAGSDARPGPDPASLSLSRGAGPRTVQPDHAPRASAHLRAGRESDAAQSTGPAPPPPAPLE